MAERSPDYNLTHLNGRKNAELRAPGLADFLQIRQLFLCANFFVQSGIFPDIKGEVRGIYLVYKGYSEPYGCINWMVINFGKLLKFVFKSS